MSGPVVGIGDAARNRTDKVCAPTKLMYLLMGRDR